MSEFNFFALLKDERGIKRIPLSRKVQAELTTVFQNQLTNLMPNGTTPLEFSDHIDYKPDENELLSISNFQMPSNITSAITNPLNYETIGEADLENIKAIFCVGDGLIIFTCFDTRKIIKRTDRKVILLYKKEIFTDFEDKMIVIDQKIDALFKDHNIYFRSFANLKKIFGELLDIYYREATDDEIHSFSNKIFGENIPNTFINSRNRKLIFAIMRQGKIHINNIAKAGKKFGLNLKIKNGKIQIPDNKQDFNKLLKLLNDDLLESPLTGLQYETNSKKRISQEG